MGSSTEEERNELLLNRDENTNYNTDSSDKLIENDDDKSSDEKDKQKPFQLKDIPLATWLIISVEIFERFSFYSLRSLLVLFFIEALHFDESFAKALYSYFSSLSYFMPLLGGTIIADALIGRFKTILYCTLVYAIGVFVLVYASYDSSRLLTYLSLLLIAFGTGSIKPNVSVFGAQSLGMFFQHFCHFLPILQFNSLCTIQFRYKSL
jgi:dipeptide/tripeptide permease